MLRDSASCSLTSIKALKRYKAYNLTSTELQIESIASIVIEIQIDESFDVSRL